LSRGLGKAARIDIDRSQQFPLALRQHLQPRWFSVARLFTPLDLECTLGCMLLSTTNSQEGIDG
jgi:hypothetical protein